MEQLSVKINNLIKNYGSKEVLNIEELSTYQTDRIGIVGANGQGKSTLLKLIAGVVDPDSGTIQKENSFHYFPQIAEVTEKTEALDWALFGRFSIPTNELATLSGGEETKYRLAQTLSSYQLGLLLDEPTTHLDQQGIQVLIEELQYYYGTLIVVSHDRYLLNQLATKIWEVDQGKVTEYAGNYDSYRQQKEQAAQRIAWEAAQYQQQKQQLTQAIQKKKEQAIKSSRISEKKRQQNIRPDRLSSSKQKDTVQKSLQKTVKAMESRLDQLEEVKGVARQQVIRFPVVPAVELHNKRPIRGEQVTIQRGAKRLLDSSSFQFAAGKKIAIVGPNGSGKSTLLKEIIAGGEGIYVSPKIVFAVYEQMGYRKNSTTPLLTELMAQTDYQEPLVRSILHNLGFSQIDVMKPVNVLSGGEATRVELACIFTQPANVLILDEPTNFIDLPTITVLEQLIRSYRGMVLFTSHDQAFIDAVADDVYQIDHGKLTLVSSN